MRGLSPAEGKGPGFPRLRLVSRGGFHPACLALLLYHPNFPGICILLRTAKCKGSKLGFFELKVSPTDSKPNAPWEKVRLPAGMLEVPGGLMGAASLGLKRGQALRSPTWSGPASGCKCQQCGPGGQARWGHSCPDGLCAHLVLAVQMPVAPPAG